MKRSEMIKKNEDIQAVLKSFLVKKNRSFVIYIKKNNIDQNKFAFLVGKKLGKAHIRNNIRRKIKMSMDDFKVKLVPGFQIIVIARMPILELSFTDIKNDLENVLKKHTILYKDKKVSE